MKSVARKISVLICAVFVQILQISSTTANSNAGEFDLTEEILVKNLFPEWKNDPRIELLAAEGIYEIVISTNKSYNAMLRYITEVRAREFAACMITNRSLKTLNKTPMWELAIKVAEYRDEKNVHGLWYPLMQRVRELASDAPEITIVSGSRGERRESKLDLTVALLQSFNVIDSSIKKHMIGQTGFSDAEVCLTQAERSGSE